MTPLLDRASLELLYDIFDSPTCSRRVHSASAVNDGPDLPKQGLCLERLLQKCHISLRHPVTDDRVVRVPAHVQHGHPGGRPCHAISYRPTTLTGHDHIRYQQVQWPGQTRTRSDRLIAPS